MDIFIDRGGTFTDCVYKKSGAMEYNTFKIPSSNSSISDCIHKVSQMENDFSKKIILSRFNKIVIASTLTTNTLLEKNGPDVALLVTKGFKDVLVIGTQQRPELFNLDIPNKTIYYKQVYEVKERVTLHASTLNTTVDKKQINTIIESLHRDNIKHIALSLVHASSHPKHELEIRDILIKNGFTVTCSHSYPIRHYLNRTTITLLDAYLTPVLQTAIQELMQRFDDPVKAQNKVFMMTSYGSLQLAINSTGTDALLSGPAGGLMSLSSIFSKSFPSHKSLLGFDMGGTSTDLSRFDGKSTSRALEFKHNDLFLQLPFVFVSTLAAGGGSILNIVNNLMTVGPGSVGSDPGPLMYNKSGKYPCISDANAVLGFLQPQYFPKCFGHDLNESLVVEKSIEGLQKLTNDLNSINKSSNSIYQIAYGYLQIATHLMASKIKGITHSKGHSISDHILCCFGGAGSQVVCQLATSLEIDTIIIHSTSSVQSAYGASYTPITLETSMDCHFELNDQFHAKFHYCLTQNQSDMYKQYNKQGVQSMSVLCRYHNSSTELAILINDLSLPLADLLTKIKDKFIEQHFALFGYSLPTFIESTRLICTNSLPVSAVHSSLYKDYLHYSSDINNASAQPSSVHSCYFVDKVVSTPFYTLNDHIDHQMQGPCVLVNDTQTIVVYPTYTATILKEGVILKQKTVAIQSFLNDSTINLSLYSLKFMSIAEEMGIVLQQTAMSVNIKSRLDYSCALFNRYGELISNAPHIPVHLGSMSLCVQSVLKLDLKNKVFITNDPQQGGTHLPDITVITPIYKVDELIGYCASRGHHADIGGISPGSMPSHSVLLKEEGIVLHTILVENNKLCLENITPLLKASRCPNEVQSDLQAQIAANNKGCQLMLDLVEKDGINQVDKFMSMLLTSSKETVQSFLISKSKELGNSLSAIDFMDDGSQIRLTITIENDGNALFDFTGTSLMGFHNLNAPISITYSAVLYCLRCLINKSIPLNSGCLLPITFIVPLGSFLNPDFTTIQLGVVGGNVMTSQRIVDVVFKAFNACAASQGCCNNLTFGNERFGFYETIGGGSGATSHQNGKDGVHTHMTNTRISDVEVMEHNYPVVVSQFKIRENSGGNGHYKGGNGIIREIEFCEDMNVSILSSRRSIPPYGLLGGQPGQLGKNTWIHKQISIQLGGSKSFNALKGDSILIETPGGGGYGNSNDEK